MGGEARELGHTARTAAVSRPPCALAPLQQPLTAGSPHGRGSPHHLGTEIVQGDVGGLGGGGSCYLLRQKDAGQHFTCNHLNVFAVFRIQNPGWGGAREVGKKSFHLFSRLRVSRWLCRWQLLAHLQ